MMPFSTELGWSVLGSLGRTRIDAGQVHGLWMWLFSAKRTRKKKGRQGLRPWPLRCLSQFLSERKDRLLRGRMCCVCLRMSMRTFHRWGGLVFIMDDHDNFPNWIMILNSMFPNWMMTLNSMFPSRRMI